MKKAFLLIVISLIVHLSFGQDRSEGLTRLTNNRNDARIIQRNVIRNVNRNVYRNIRYDGWANAGDWRGIGSSIRSQAYGADHYESRPTRDQVREQIRSEIRHVRNMVRNGIRSGLRFLRD